jgi:hypothetical protein
MSDEWNVIGRNDAAYFVSDKKYVKRRFGIIDTFNESENKH